MVHGVCLARKDAPRYYGEILECFSWLKIYEVKKTRDSESGAKKLLVITSDFNHSRTTLTHKDAGIVNSCSLLGLTGTKQSHWY